MMELEEFRQEFINEDVYAEAVNTNRYPEVVFIDHCVDILQNDFSNDNKKSIENVYRVGYNNIGNDTDKC